MAVCNGIGDVLASGTHWAGTPRATLPRRASDCERRRDGFRAPGMPRR